MGHQAGHSLVACTTDPLDDRILLPSFWPEQEDDLYNVVMQFAQQGFPFTDNKLCVLAYELASRNNRRGFSPLKKHAGRSWLKGFLARYPNLKRKSPKICPLRALLVLIQLRLETSLIITGGGSTSGDLSVNPTTFGMWTNVGSTMSPKHIK